MQKMSAIVKDMAMTLLKSRDSVPSGEAAHAALLFVHVAWNKSLGNDDAYRNYQMILNRFEESNPALWNEFITSDHEAILAGLSRYKEEYYPDDPRVIVVCGMREENVHVEWTDQGFIKRANAEDIVATWAAISGTGSNGNCIEHAAQLGRPEGRQLAAALSVAETKTYYFAEIGPVNDTSDEDLIRTYEAFSKEMTDYLALAEKTGGRSVEFQTAYLYSRVEGLQADSIKMLVCMRVMKDHMLPGDKVIDEPDDFDGRYLKIRFQLPRKVSRKVEKKG